MNKLFSMLSEWQFWVAVVLVIVATRFIERTVPQIRQITGGI